MADESGKYGFIDTTGKVAVPFQYHWVSNFSEGLAAVEDESGKWGYIDTTGKTVIPFQNHYMYRFSDGMAWVMDESRKYGLIDTTGKLVIPFQYNWVGILSEGLAAVEGENGKWGFIDTTGKLVIPFQYDDAAYFYKGLACVQNESGKWGFIDATGKVVVPFQYDEIFARFISVERFDGVTFAIKQGKWFILNLNGDGQPSGFTDVAAGAYYADAVAWAVEKGITTGTGSNTFSPEITCTTAQILTFLWRANGSPAPAGSDASVPAGQYYSDAANWALEKGLTDSFTADTPCTRLATVTYLWKLAGSPAVTDENPFTDVTGDAQAVVWAMKEGITTGSSTTTFSPDTICTRGQIVTFLHRDLAE